MKVFAILRKEILSGFASFVVYVIFSIFLFVSGIMFYALTRNAAGQAFSMFGSSGSVMDTIFRPLQHNFAIILMFLTPWLTMRLFSEERRNGTLELLFTYPLRDIELLLGKFKAGVSLLLFILIPTLLYPLMLRHFAPIEWKVIGIQYLGLTLLASSYVAVGVWASTLTDNQLVSAATTFGTLLSFLFVGWVSPRMESSRLGDVMSQLSILDHFDNFAKGILNTTDVSYYLLFVAFFLWLSLTGLQARSWWGAQE